MRPLAVLSISISISAILLCSAVHVSADEIPTELVDPGVQGVWIRHVPQGKKSKELVLASLYLGKDGGYALSYSGKEFRPGEFGKITSRNGKWHLEPKEGVAKDGTYSIDGDKLLWADGKEKTIWDKSDPLEQIIYASAVEQAPRKEQVLAWISDTPSSGRTVLIPESRQMMAKAGDLFDPNRSQEKNREPTIRIDSDGTIFMTTESGIVYRVNPDNTTTMDSGDTDADEVYNALMSSRWDDAIAASNRLLSRDPNNSFAYGNLAEAYRHKGDYVSMIRTADRAIQLASEGWYEANTGRGPRKSARASLFDADSQEAVNGALVSGYERRGVGHLLIGNTRQALLDLTEAINRSKRPNADTYLFRGQAYVNLDRYQEALADLNQAILLNGKDPVSYCFRGFAYKRLGNDLLGKLDTETAISLRPSFKQRCEEIQS